MSPDHVSPSRSVQVRPAYTIQQFGAPFGIGRSKTYFEISSGRLRTFKVGGRTLIAGEDAIAWRDCWHAAKAG
jgi:hypothetical protein